MITDIKLLPHTQIVARTVVGHVQMSLDNGPENLVIHCSGSVGGNNFSLPPKSIPSSAPGMSKALAIGPVLKTGLTYLGAKAEEQPQGLPVEITVKDGDQQYTQQFSLKLDLGALSQFQNLLGWIQSVNNMVRR